MAKTKLLPEFPSEWHQEAYLEGLEREKAGYERRLTELEAVSEEGPAYTDAKSGLKAVKAEIDRVKPKKKAATKKTTTKKATAKK